MTTTAIHRDRRSCALLVEDDAAIRRLVTKVLTRKGIDVEAVPGGEEAKARLASRRYAVIVLDLMLPDIDGFALVDYIKEQQIETPVAIVSAVSAQALTRLDLDIVKVVISKPFDIDEFSKAIVELVAG